MSEDANKKIQQITELLGQEELPENIKSLLNMLANSLSGSSGGNPAPKEVTSGSASGDSAGSDVDAPIEAAEDDLQNSNYGENDGIAKKPAGAGVGPGMGSGMGTGMGPGMGPGMGADRPAPFSGTDINDITARLKKAINSLGNLNDPRINLLNAIRPFLNSRRQKKINNCIQLLQITSLTRLMNEQEK
jgi:hypothetical protein